MDTVAERPDAADQADVARPRRLAVLGLVAVAALTTTVLLLAGGGAPEAPIPGLPDPGRLTGWGLPALRLASDVLAVAVVAALLVSPLTMRRPGDEIGGSTLRALRSVRWLAGAWCVAALATVVLTWSDQFAVPLGDVRWGELRSFATSVDQTRALLVQAALLAIVAVWSRWALTHRTVLVLLALTVGALVPPVLTGHSSSSGNHDTAIVGMLLHVTAAVVWLAGVAALWWHLPRATKVRDRALSRFSAIATWCFGVTLASGLISAAVRLGSIDGLWSAYGAGVVLKVVAVLLVGLVALTIRRRVIASANGTVDWRLLVRLSGLELAVMSVAVGLGVALSRTPPPVPDDLYVSLATNLLGGPMPPEPTLGRLLWSFTPSGLGIAVVLGGAVAYLVGVRTLRRRGDSWPVWRTVVFLLGLLVVAYATMGGLGTYARVMFSAHMASHMALSMIAPILIVTGRPINLALRALPGSDVPGGRGPRQILADALDSRPARILMHPVTASFLLVGSLYVVFLSGIFDTLMRSHLGHVVMEFHFLMAGILFFEVLLGDRPGHQVSYVGRLMMLLITMPFHAFFSITVMNSQDVIGGEYYRLLDVPWVDDLLADQNLAGSMNWALGEVPMVMVIVILVIQWFRDDQREARRRDRKADRDGDAELEAYNAMLGRIGAEVQAEEQRETQRDASSADSPGGRD